MESKGGTKSAAAGSGVGKSSVRTSTKSGNDSSNSSSAGGRRSISVSPGRMKSKSPNPRTKASTDSTISQNNNTNLATTTGTTKSSSKKRKSRSKSSKSASSADTDEVSKEPESDDSPSPSDLLQVEPPDEPVSPVSPVSNGSAATSDKNETVSTTRKTSPSKSPNTANETNNPSTSAAIKNKNTNLGTQSSQQQQQQKPSLTSTEDGAIPSTSGGSSATGRSPSRSRSRDPAKSSLFRQQIMKAVQDRKIFSTHASITYQSLVRGCLKSRGWIEKTHTGILNPRTVIGPHLTRELEFRGTEDEKDEIWSSRVLEKYPSDFIWVVRRDNVDFKQLLRDQMINRFPRANFTTKVGITSCLQNMHWFTEPGLADTFFPRCYRLSMEEEKIGFVDDFRLTACISLLKWLVNRYEAQGEGGVMDDVGTSSILSVDFAARQANNYVRTRRHEDVDWIVSPQFSNSHWDAFLALYYEIVHKNKKFNRGTDNQGLWERYNTAKKSLIKLKQYWPQFDIDGTHNLWICKPGARSRGKGIVVMDELEKVLDLVNNGNQREANWVVQKYIERPMLIYKTKFDIRQWFLITDWNPITIWFYKESYIRFCSRTFSLDDFHEAIHLCNNAIQANYPNPPNRDKRLPDENMWDCFEFQGYLQQIGKLDAWSQIIYPGMKESIVGVMLASQDTIEQRKNCFELYGADFMLSEDFRPWLIEINSCPCMSGTTSVTARMCAECIEDVIKVVVDRRDNIKSDTGRFELIYRQNPANLMVQQFGAVDLYVQGKKLPKDIDWPTIMTKYNSKRVVRVPPTAQKPATPIGHGLTFHDLILKLRKSEESDGSTTPFAQSSLGKEIQQNRSPLSSQESNNSKAKKSGPMITFKGFPASKAPFTPDYKEMAPVYTQIQNRAQNFKTTAQGATKNNKENPSTGAAGIPWQTFNQNISNSQSSKAESSKIRQAIADLTTVVRNSNPAAPTFADLIKINQKSEESSNKKKQLSPEPTNVTTEDTGPLSQLSQPKRKNQSKHKSTHGQSSASPRFQIDTVNGSLKEAVHALRRTSKSRPKKSRKGSGANPSL